MTLYHFTANTSTASVREITHDGRRYLVAPVVALKAGVINGYLVPQDELSKYAEAWNGRPLSLNHPQTNGQYVSANSPDLWSQMPGMLWNAHVDGDALKAEMWIDLDKATKLGGDALTIVQRLRANQPVEVSTGYFADIIDDKGLYGGKAYNGVQRNIRPDHLALLPNEQGACNWADGCGAPRVNRKGTGMPNGLTTNELALDDRLHLVRGAFRDQMAKAMGPEEEPWEWDMVGIFNETLIAKDWKAKTHMAYPYTLADDGAVSFGEAMPVDVVYRAKDGGAEVVVANTQEGREQQERGLFRRFLDWWNQMEPELTTNEPAKRKDGVMKNDELVAALVANERCKFAKSTLETWEDDQLAILHEMLAEPEPEPQTQPNVNAPATVELPAEITAFAQMLANLGGVGKLQEALGVLTANADQERAQLVQGILANERNSFEEPELQAMTTAQLRKLASMFAPRNYTGAAGAFYNGQQDEEYVLEMPAAWPEKGE